MVTDPYLLPPEAVRTLEGWRALGGGEGLAACLALGPEATIEAVTRSGLRGRGGGGFPTGRKWAGVRDQPGSRRYVVANGAEGEPATFKDRAIMRANPYQVVEGLVIAALAVGAERAYLCVKERFERELAAVTAAIEEMAEAGLTAEVPVTVVAGPDEYLFGEEKAMLEVIEGRPPMPRLFPPYEHGLFAVAPQMGWESVAPRDPSGSGDQSNPTAVNNVETLAHVPHLLARGADWFRSLGTEASPGHGVVTVVGDVRTPACAEFDLGTPLRALVEEVGGGVAPGREVKAAFSGVANPVLTPAMLDTPVAFETMAAAGTGMGAAGYVVYDDTACMVQVAALLSRFLWVESCGQCPPCKLGCEEVTRRLAALEACRASDRDVAAIGARLEQVTDANRCFLGAEEQALVASVLRAYPDDFAAHLEGDCGAHRADLVVPKLVDLEGGRAVYDERQARKQPDWTYA